MHQRPIRRRLLAAVAACLLSGASPGPCGGGAAAQSGGYDWFDPIIDLRLLLEQGYIERPDAKAMQEAALAAIVAALDDPYSVYVPERSERAFAKSLRGSYVGIGAEIDMPDGWLRVVAPLEGSPAEAAGILPGDIVLSIDGEPTRGRSVDACLDLLLGEPGSPVRLEVRHADGRETALTVERREIQTRALRGFRRGADRWEHAIDPGRRIAYVRMTQFLDRVAEDLAALLRPAEGEAPAGLVLDLRFNGGGSLGAALRVADLFLAEGAIVRVVGREGQERVFSASADALDLDIPIVILVNESSASASEILAGALQHHGRAKVLGTRTYGKGTVQEVRPLGEGLGSVKLTVARYLLPNGRSIARPARVPASELAWGVDPDRGFRVGLDEGGQRALFLARRRWELPFEQPSSARWDDPDWIAAAPGEDGTGGAGDPQLAAALRALQAHLDTGGPQGGSWPRVGEDPTPDTVASDELRRQLDARERLARELEALDRRIDELRLAATSRPAERPPVEPAK